MAEDQKRRQEQYEKLKASVETPPAKAKPSAKALPAESKPPSVKAMPGNRFHSLNYCQENSSVEIESVSDEEPQAPVQAIAVPMPKHQQQYKTYEAAIKRLKKQR